MFRWGRLKFKGVDRKYVKDETLAAEYESAPAIGRVRFGGKYFYYRDLGVKYYVPYDHIERAFIRISETQPDDSPPYYYYRLVLVHGEKEFANLIFNKEPDADAALARLSGLCPDMAVGYVPPEGGSKPSFK